MTTLESANARLDDALVRLEAAITKQKNKTQSSDSGMADEILMLRRECSELRDRLAAAESQNRSIRQDVGKVSTELGDTIADLDSLLEK